LEIGFEWSTTGIKIGIYFFLNIIIINDLWRRFCGGDRKHLQDDFSKLRSEKWQMLFNFGKCDCLHTWHENDDVQLVLYEICSHEGLRAVRNCIKFSFSQRRVTKWNTLSAGCVRASSGNVKKKSTYT